MTQQSYVAQAHVMQAAADISSILAGEKKKKKSKLDPNKMAALALIFNPVRQRPPRVRSLGRTAGKCWEKGSSIQCCCLGEVTCNSKAASTRVHDEGCMTGRDPSPVLSYLVCAHADNGCRCIAQRSNWALGKDR